MCLTTFSSQKDQIQGNISPIFFGKKRHQVFFHSDGIALCSQPENFRNTIDVRVDYDSFHESVNLGQNDVCGFTAESGKCNKLRNCLGDFTVKVVYQFFSKTLNGLCLIAVETRGKD